MIIGTAGHVDHGKTLLVQRLTGVDTDRLAEEKRRGITIDLGFAYLPAPDGEILGFVDVPGHERFVRTMIAGASAVQAVLLVIAANEGIKPQTVEHMQILDMLGIRSGIVALNKIDLVTADERRRAERDIRAFLRNTNLADAEIVPVSATEGYGIDVLREKLFAIAQHQATVSGGAFRLAIDRAFSLAGAGTIVTGTILSGSVTVGDEVAILPQMLSARVRALRAQGRETRVALQGQRCALNISGRNVSKDTVARGDWALATTHCGLTDRVDAEVTLLASAARPVKDGTQVHLHVGASDVPARAIVLSMPSLAAGSSAFVQFVLDKPLPLRHGDRLVVRDASSAATIGGGLVLDVRPPLRRRRHSNRLTLLGIHQNADPAAALLGLLDQPHGFINIGAFAGDRMLQSAEASMLAEQLSLRSVSDGTENYVTTERNWTQLSAEIATLVAEHHRNHPADPGMAINAIRKSIGWPNSAALFHHVVLVLARQRMLVLNQPWVRLPDHTAEISPQEAKAQTRILDLIMENESKPPRVHETAELLDMNEIHVRRLCKAMAKFGTLVEVATDRFFSRETIVRWAHAAQVLAERVPGNEFTAATFRTEIKSGRTVAIQVLEYFDRHGLTQRRGDLRRVTKDPRLTFGRQDGEDANNLEGNRSRWDVRTSNPGRAVSRL